MFSRSCEYALQAILYITLHSQKGSSVGLKQISKSQKVPLHFLSKILQQLVRRKILKSVKDEKMIIDRVTHKNVDNKGVNIHYVTVGEGPVLLFVHGAPDFWYLWHNQMEVLSDS